MTGLETLVWFAIIGNGILIVYALSYWITRFIERRRNNTPLSEAEPLIAL